MHGHSHPSDIILASDRDQLAENTHLFRRYSLPSNTVSSSNYWGYGSSYSSVCLDYVEHSSSHWSINGSIPGHAEAFSALPRTINSYDQSERSTDVRRPPFLKGEVDQWAHSQQWASPTLSHPSSQSWDTPSATLTAIDPYETKPHIHDTHHDALVHVGSCSPISTLSTVSSSSPSPPPVLDDKLPKLGRRPNPKQPKSCYHCHATSTPLWRREPLTFRTLCNACGLYLQQRNKLRPQELIDADIEEDKQESEEEDAANQSGPQCTHCHTRNTSVWRRSKTGAQLCNACGVYARLRGKDRPLSLKRKKIKPRTKHPKPASGKD
ncbi:hypothetical protein F5878DRAFT_618328 [Lentinula raphanica]|uniref:GATA-type domain-containing protein n=1 Tax=Lentinula raphanica TaxID=153919 RepID=A0AA38UF12_9AGAR|nr:hypothetical protein F5878DRAFT_618328 [Lentinula raphanica]